MKIFYQNPQNPQDRMAIGRSFLWTMIKQSSFAILIQFLLVGMLAAESSAGQDLSEIKLSLELKDGSLIQAFKKIEDQTNLKFVYNQEQIKQYKNLDFDIKGQDVAQVMEKLLKNTTLTYQYINNNIIILAKETGKEKQSTLIRGKVTDGETGESMPGVNIIINGTTIGTVTDIDGNYNINVPDEDAVLVFSFVGYQTEEVAVNQQSIINMQLIADAQSLNEVVVTALNFESSKKEIGYSVTQLEGEKINTVPTPNIVSNLSGKVAGVDVGNMANGVAGSKRIIIRGASSLTGDNQPLWVVDGIPINSSNLGTSSAYGGIDYGDGLTGINAEDIESMSILKGNAAAALYGSRASNGVILVTTKSGRNATDKINIDISSSLIFDRVFDLTDHQTEYGQSSRVNINQRPIDKEDAFGSGSWGPKLDGVPTVQFDGVERPYSAVEDNYERFFRTGSTLTNTIALAGKVENHNYRISLSDLRNTDVVPNAEFSRTGLNLKTSSDFGRLKADIVVNYIYEKAENRPFIGGNVSNMFYSLTFLPANIDIETLKPGFNPDGTEFTYADFINNPYFIINKEKETDKKNRLNGSISLQYDFSESLYARGRFTRDYYNFNRLAITPGGVLYRGYLDGDLDQRSRENVENNYELILGVNPVGGNAFKVSGFVGGNINWRTTNQIIVEGNTFVVPGVYTFNNLKNKFPATSEARQRTNSLFGSIEMNFRDYLFLNLTGRNDWFSTLPIDNNNLFYPSAALSFVFSDAFTLPAFVSFGKLRLSTAQVSGDTGPGQLDLSYRLEDVQYNSNSLQVIGTGNIPNRNLEPLLSSDYETGLEIDFLNNRLGFDLAYYKRTTKNDIVRTGVSVATGYSSAILNVGEMQNSGIEILMKATPFSKNNFEWSFITTFSKNDNRVIALGDGLKGAPIELAESKSKDASIKVVEGEPYGQIYGIGYERDENGRKVYDDQGYPVRTSEHVLLGNGVYKTLMGFSNTLRWKNLSFNFLIDAKFGADIYSESNVLAVGNGTHKMTLNGRVEGFVGNGVNESGEENNVLVPASEINEYYSRVSSIAEEFIYDASFVKLREFSVNYSFPSQLLDRIGFNSASVTLVARNLLTLYQNTENVDPESNIVSGNAQGIERFGYPATRNYGITLRLGF